MDEKSRAMLITSMAVAMVKNDDQGNVRLVKKSSNNTARDDIAAALTQAAGAFTRNIKNITAGGIQLPGVIR